MIKRLYVDNFKCLVNFEYEPGAFQLILGENGCGKSTVVDVLAKLREFIAGEGVCDLLFPAASLTRWQTSLNQTFELDIDGNGGRYAYRLTIEHEQSPSHNRVSSETLRYGGRPLYDFDGKDAHLFTDSFAEGPIYPQRASRSGVASVPERADMRLLSWFRNRLRQTYIFAIEPMRMASTSEKETSYPDRGLADFASWYRHLSQESPSGQVNLFAALSKVMDGFAGLYLQKEGERTRVLRAGIAPNMKIADNFSVSFDELSDGQRCLVALFTILHFVVHDDVTICLDEPDNYVALRELQPWLIELEDRLAQTTGQCLIISHHPEIINRLVGDGIRFCRSEQGPVRVKPFTWSKDDAIPPSEIVARGWED